MKAGIECICKICLVSALCGQLLEGGRFYASLRLIIALRILLIILNTIESII